MVQKQPGGTPTERKLDIVRDPSDWAPVLNAYLNNASAPLTCPLCGGKRVHVTAEHGEDHIGFAIIHCLDCGKSAHFSRLLFPSH